MSIKLMELMEGIRPAGPPDTGRRFHEKFAKIYDNFNARELEISLYQLMRTMLASTVDVQAKIATSGLIYICNETLLQKTRTMSSFSREV